MCSTAPSYPKCAKYPTLYPPECPKCSPLSFSSSQCYEYNNLVNAISNYSESRVPGYSFGAGLRKFWEEWDLRVLILYILYTQLYLLIFGRCRKRSTSKILINLNVWLLYIFSDLLAAIALGKLSKVKDEGTFNKDAVLPKFNADEICNPEKPESLLRGLWAPVILFYLGGPDTITLLCIEETQLWIRHLISLFTQGARTCYVLIVTWTPCGLSVLTLLMLISGIIKYAERTWVIKSRTRAISEGFLKPDDCTVIDLADICPASPKRKLEKQTELVIEGYICFQTLKPHIPGYHVVKRPLDKFMKEATNPDDIFTQIAIELGFMYDVLFSKVGTIFTAWGFILRFTTLSCVVCVLVGFFIVDKPSNENLKDDLQITIILLIGAILLEIAGLFVQLVSDWAVVWAWKHQNKLSSPVLYLHEHLISKRQRWSEFVGQFSLLNFCVKYEPSAFNRMVRAVCGWGKLLSIYFSLPMRKVNPTMKALILKQLRERSQNNSSLMKPVEWTLHKYGCEQAFKWTMDLEFGEAIVVWHIATDICYHCDSQEPSDDSEAAKRLSYYMMHLLLIRPHKLPFSNRNGGFWPACTETMELLKSQKHTHADACERVKDTPPEHCRSITLKRAKILAGKLMWMLKEERWEMMNSMWVELLCHAAKECNVKYHAQELRHGGEFLSHVWLLMMHFGSYGDQERIIPPDLRGAAQEMVKSYNDVAQSTFFEDWSCSCLDGSGGA